MEEGILKSVTGRAMRKDSLEMKLGTDVLKEIVQIYYIDNFMKADDVAEVIKGKFNTPCSGDSVLRIIERLGMKRSKAEAISLGKCTLKRDKIINDKLKNIIDGLLFGDGSSEINVDTKVGRIKMGSCHEEFSLYCSECLKDYLCSKPKYFTGTKGVGMWNIYTKFHPDIYEQHLRWYPDGIKTIPSDIEFSPEMILFWYLGDGCLSSPLKGNARYMYFATNCFSRESLEEVVVPKFKEIGVDVSRVTDDCRVFIETGSINALLEYMGGKSPVRCFDYKFSIEEWRTYTPMKKAALELNIDYGRLSNWVKFGLIEHDRSPGGKKVVFTSEQLAKLSSRLDSGELPRERGAKHRIQR